MKPQCVLITGASSGIGKQLAVDYANQGSFVIACGRNAPTLEALAAVHPNIEPLVFDTTNEDQTYNSLSSLSKNPELIILNAGTCEYIEQGQLDPALFKRVFNVNVFGVVNCIAGLQHFLTKGTHLALMGSTAAYVGLPRAEAYGASKAALSYLAKSLSVDLEEYGVTVSLISPGFVKTPLTDKNDFAMPMMVTPEEASVSIRKGIERGKREIHFPRKFSLFLKAISLLPISVQVSLVKRITRRAA
ncbi:SDR family NAD(P)-dependent oxidoreductase [Parasalinivibrio latis]|uniref:SDR family NAD(P)-dependent oxidoreductase n=1 Tax=Parasalinivibrio latis TaxID=2952610 RepID=UPI0030E52831